MHCVAVAVAVRCSVLCVVVCWTELLGESSQPIDAVCCSGCCIVLQYIAVCCSVMLYRCTEMLRLQPAIAVGVAACCSVLQFVAASQLTLQQITKSASNKLQHPELLCHMCTLQHTATHCKYKSRELQHLKMLALPCESRRPTDCAHITNTSTNSLLSAWTLYNLHLMDSVIQTSRTLSTKSPFQDGRQSYLHWITRCNKLQHINILIIVSVRGVARI